MKNCPKIESNHVQFGMNASLEINEKAGEVTSVNLLVAAMWMGYHCIKSEHRSIPTIQLFYTS